MIKSAVRLEDALIMLLSDVEGKRFEQRSRLIDSNWVRAGVHGKAYVYNVLQSCELDWMFSLIHGPFNQYNYCFIVVCESNWLALTLNNWVIFSIKIILFCVL